jgi:FkbM family methyltransferase
MYAGDVCAQMFAPGDMVVHIEEREPFEPDVRECWAVLCEDAAVALDVGAYTGFYSIVAAKLGCEVWAFEPHPGNRERLKANVMLNGEAVRLVEAALGNPKSGHECVAFSYNSRMPFSSGGAIIGCEHVSPVASRNEKIPVDLYRMDNWCFTDVGAVKIDVEGAELDVLWGGVETLRRNAPGLIVELLGDAARRDVGEWLKGQGYVGEQLDRTNWLFQHKTEI